MINRAKGVDSGSLKNTWFIHAWRLLVEGDEGSFVSAQLSNKFGYCPWRTVSRHCFVFSKTQQLTIRYEPSSPVGCCSPQFIICKSGRSSLGSKSKVVKLIRIHFYRCSSLPCESHLRNDASFTIFELLWIPGNGISPFPCSLLLHLSSNKMDEFQSRFFTVLILTLTPRLERQIWREKFSGNVFPSFKNRIREF